jgi:hypothetical protein
MEREKIIFDKIGALIPGYRGYAEREGRRQCDKLLREEIASIIAQCEKIINDQIDAEVKNRDTTKAGMLENNRKYLNTLASKIKFAPYGASSFFGNSQIKEAELEQIYKKDLDILEKANSLKQNINNRGSENVLLEIKEIEELLAARNQFIKEFK